MHTVTKSVRTTNSNDIFWFNMTFQSCIPLPNNQCYSKVALGHACARACVCVCVCVCVPGGLVAWDIC